MIDLYDHFSADQTQDNAPDAPSDAPSDAPDLYDTLGKDGIPDEYQPTEEPAPVVRGFANDAEIARAQTEFDKQKQREMASFVRVSGGSQRMAEQRAEALGQPVNGPDQAAAAILAQKPDYAAQERDVRTGLALGRAVQGRRQEARRIFDEMPTVTPGTTSEQDPQKAAKDAWIADNQAEFRRHVSMMSSEPDARIREELRRGLIEKMNQEPAPTEDTGDALVTAGLHASGAIAQAAGGIVRSFSQSDADRERAQTDAYLAQQGFRAAPPAEAPDLYERAVGGLADKLSNAGQRIMDRNQPNPGTLAGQVGGAIIGGLPNIGIPMVAGALGGPLAMAGTAGAMNYGERLESGLHAIKQLHPEMDPAEQYARADRAATVSGITSALTMLLPAESVLGSKGLVGDAVDAFIGGAPAMGVQSAVDRVVGASQGTRKPLNPDDITGVINDALIGGLFASVASALHGLPEAFKRYQAGRVRAAATPEEARIAATEAKQAAADYHGVGETPPPGPTHPGTGRPQAGNLDPKEASARAVLGIDPTAPLDADGIRIAWAAKVREVHPDATGEETAQLFQQVQEARDYLSRKYGGRTQPRKGEQAARGPEPVTPAEPAPRAAEPVAPEPPRKVQPESTPFSQRTEPTDEMAGFVPPPEAAPAAPAESEYDAAVRVTREAGRASASVLQRKLGIGYSRAFDLLQQMREAGVIGDGKTLTGVAEVLPEQPTSTPTQIPPEAAPTEPPSPAPPSSQGIPDNSPLSTAEMPTTTKDGQDGHEGDWSRVAEPLQPWQMTRDELADVVNPKDRKSLEVARPAEEAKVANIPHREWSNAVQDAARADKVSDEVFSSWQENSGKPWEIPLYKPGDKVDISSPIFRGRGTVKSVGPDVVEIEHADGTVSRQRPESVRTAEPDHTSESLAKLSPLALAEVADKMGLPMKVRPVTKAAKKDLIGRILAKQGEGTAVEQPAPAEALPVEEAKAGRVPIHELKIASSAEAGKATPEEQAAIDAHKKKEWESSNLHSKAVTLEYQVKDTPEAIAAAGAAMEGKRGRIREQAYQQALNDFASADPKVKAARAKAENAKVELWHLEDKINKEVLPAQESRVTEATKAATGKYTEQLREYPWWEVDGLIKKLTPIYEKSQPGQMTAEEQDAGARLEIAKGISHEAWAKQRIDASKIREEVLAKTSKEFVPYEAKDFKGVANAKRPLAEELEGVSGSEIKTLEKRGKKPADYNAMPFTPEHSGIIFGKMTTDAEPTNITRNRAAQAMSGILNLKDFIRTVPEFALDPHFTVTEDGKRLQFQDGGKYTFTPEHLGIVMPAEAKPGERIRIDVEAAKKMKKGTVLLADPAGAPPDRPPLASGHVALPSPAVILGEMRHLRDRLSPIEAQEGPVVTKWMTKQIQAYPEATSIVRQFMRKAFSKAPPTTAEDFISLGHHIRADILRAAGNPASGLPTLTPAEASRITADPHVQRAVDIWNADVAPMIQEIRLRNHLSMSAAGSSAKLFLNLPTEAGATSPDGTSMNLKDAFSQPATGEGVYKTDPEEALTAIVGGHLRTDAANRLKIAIRRDASIPMADVTYEDGTPVGSFRKPPKGEKFVAKFKGRETPVEVIDLNKDEGKFAKPDYHYVSKRVADVFNNVHQKADGDTILDKAQRLVVRGMLVGDFAPHTLRLLYSVGGRMAQGGESIIGMMPSWLGNIPMAIKGMREMAKGPWGGVMQLLLDRTGSARGEGYGVKPAKTWIGKLLNVPHNWLMDPEHGVDPMGRRLVAEAHLKMQFGSKYLADIQKQVDAGTLTVIDAAKQIERKMTPAQFQGLGRRVNATLGFFNRDTRSPLINRLAWWMPFIPSESGMLVDEIRKFTTLNVNIPASARAFHEKRYGDLLKMVAGSLATGILGTLLLMEGINFATSGHSMDDNQEGHKLDIDLGKGWHVSNFDPTLSRAARLLSTTAIANHKHPNIGREMVNEAFAVLNPAFRWIFSGVTGKDLRIGEDNKLAPVQSGSKWPIGIGRSTAQNFAQGKSVAEGAIKDATSFLSGWNVSRSDRPTFSPAERLAKELTDHMDKDMTPEEKQRHEDRKGEIGQIRKGGAGVARDVITHAAQAGKLGKGQGPEIVREGLHSDFWTTVHRLSMDKAMQVWREEMPESQRLEIWPIVVEHINKNKEATAAQKIANLREVAAKLPEKQRKQILAGIPGK